MLAPPPPRRPRPIAITVPSFTLLKLTVYGALLFLLIKLIHFLGLLLVALLIAITLWPLANAIWKRGGPKWLGILVCGVLVFGSVGLFFFVVTPVAAGQINGLIKTLPTFKDHIMQHLPESGDVRGLAESLLQSPTLAKPEPLLEKFITWGVIALQALVEVAVLLIVALYFVADGKRVYLWLVAFLPERQRGKVARAGEEISGVVFSYMGGQLITSTLCGIYIFTLLALLHVPNALLMSIIGAVFDVLPLVGFFIALTPAVAMAATVSPAKAMYVVIFYVLYHIVENYFIVPKVYGDRLRLSTLTVFVSCLAAGLVGGVVGVIVVLPLIASYPIIERTWLRPVLHPDTVETHDKIEEQEHPNAEA